MRDRREPVDLSESFVDGVRAVLERHHYDRDTLLEHMGGHATVEVNDKTLPALLYATREGQPLDTLVRLLVLGVEVSEQAAAAALAPVSVDAWVEGGLLERTEGGLRSPFRLTHQYDVRAIIDPPSAVVQEDHVVGLGPASAELIAAATPTTVGRALDLGTGCGGTALRFAGHAREVVATDLNQRAVCLARFNAMLNQVTNVDFRCGDLLDPVAGETFDLVAMNPPFVISPGGRLMFRDGGAPGDTFVRRVVAEVPSVLNPGGLAVLLAQWATIEGQRWEDRLASWVEGSGCDALVVVRKDLEPVGYAAGWLAEIGTPPEQGATELARWLDFYREQRIIGMTLGWIVLRKREGANWFEVRDGTEGVNEGALDTLRALIAATDFLRATSSLADAVLTLNPSAVIDQRLVPAPGGWTPDAMHLRLTEGVHATMGIDGNMAHLLGGCDGTRTVGALAADLATRLGATPASVLRGLDPPLRRLIARGVLHPHPH